jgi:uncharacterized protein YbjT (DUF2867 family)
MSTKGVIVVTGATGRQGGAVARQLLRDGWQVRAVTRKPNSQKARALATLGAEVIGADMSDRASLLPAFSGAYGAYSVQNPMLSGLEGEVQQGKLVGDVAREAGVCHFVYGSAGMGQSGTGIGSWESKLQVEAHLRAIELPVTVLRPVAFMELMTDKTFYPAASTWRVMPRLMTWTRPIGWVSVDDLGTIAAKVFANPDEFLGREVKLASDVQSLEACRAHYTEVVGKPPPSFPMPTWLLERFVGTDITTMWRWLATARIDFDTTTARAVHPGALTVREWLQRQLSASPS